VDEELAFHVEQRVRYYMERGLNEDEARRAALERLGDLEGVREDCVDAVRTLRELRDTYVSPRRLPAVMLTSFASLASLLACVGR
jgi:hypothetical protein